MKKLLACVVVAFLGLGACKDDHTAPTASGPAAKPAAPSVAGSAATGGGRPVPVTATALFAEHVAAGGTMPDLPKYKAGVLVSGTVINRIDDLGSTFIHLGAGENKRVALTFSDQGAAVRARGVKIGDEIVAGCQLGEMSGPIEAILGSCVLQ